MYIQQQDARITRTTCENLVPKGQEILKNVTETFKDDKLGSPAYMGKIG